MYTQYAQHSFKNNDLDLSGSLCLSDAAHISFGYKTKYIENIS